MTSIPPSLARVPNQLSAAYVRANVGRTNVGLLSLQNQLSSGLRIQRPSEDPVGASLVSVIDDRLDLAAQRLRNFQHGGSVLDAMDAALGQANEMVLEAKSIAASQIGVTSDADTRLAESHVIASMVDELLALANGSVAGLHYFGGGRTAQSPFESFNGGIRYRGEGTGLRTDLGGDINFPITMGGEQAFGALSARVEGDKDLDASLRLATRIRDLRGPADFYSSDGSLTVVIDNGAPDPLRVVVDLSDAQTVGDVTMALEAAIREADPAALGGTYPNAIGVNTDRLSIGMISASYTITFEDGPSGATAKALAIDNFSFTSADDIAVGGDRDLNPRLSNSTTFGSLPPSVGFTAGTIRFTNGNRTGTVDLTDTMTIGEFRDQVERLNLGVRVEIDESGDSINVVNEVSGFRLQVEELGGLTATSLGIRSLQGTTPISVFNDGRGIEIKEDYLDAFGATVTGYDFRITLADGQAFDVDLRQQDVVNVQSVIDRINDAAATNVPPITGFNAVLTQNDNGIQLRDGTVGGGVLTVEALNGSFAAEDLGLMDGTLSVGTPTTLLGEDRATVRVDSVFSDLIELRDALAGNDESGITFAGGRLEEAVDLLASARAAAGSRSSRLEAASRRLEDSVLLDETVRSRVRDVDYVSAASQFSLLQVQLQAGLQSAAQIQSLTLLDFLG